MFLKNNRLFIQNASNLAFKRKKQLTFIVPIFVLFVLSCEEVAKNSEKGQTFSISGNVTLAQGSTIPFKLNENSEVTMLTNDTLDDWAPENVEIFSEVAKNTELNITITDLISGGEQDGCEATIADGTITGKIIADIDDLIVSVSCLNDFNNPF